MLPLAAGITLDPISNIGLLALAVGVAWLSWAIVEEPFRKARIPRPTMTRLSLQLGTAAIVGVVAWSITLDATADAAIAGIGGGSDAMTDTTASGRGAGDRRAVAVVGSAHGAGRRANGRRRADRGHGRAELVRERLHPGAADG